MRIAIVNDLPLAVEVLRRLVRSVPGYQVAWTAADGVEAVEKCVRDRPDLVLMDLIMPVMDGVQATCSIMKQSPCAILVVTATVSGNASKVFEAMGCGALDAVCTPVFGSTGGIEGGEDLLRKIAVIGRIIGQTKLSAPVPEPSVPPVAVSRGKRLIGIGASTGGPKALAAVLRGLPPRVDAAVAIVQHLDAQFATGLADWLGEQTELPVALARDGEKPEPGRVYVAGTSDHLVIGADQSFHYTREPEDYPYRPSVDEFFYSLGQFWPEPGVACLLTGMGRDGAEGLLGLRKAGWWTLAQDEATSVVYGMPRAAVELGAAAETLSINQIPAAILRQMNKGR
ncbi:MAG: chemotaxis response regulator protein-glutamate methylesterase [Acidobacteriales bacterium]|nr:chemotaxis response regulator protein-glutamate methylesterase [Terriglobales bacterium]